MGPNTWRLLRIVHYSLRLARAILRGCPAASRRALAALLRVRCRRRAVEV